MQIIAAPVPFYKLSDTRKGEGSAKILIRVICDSDLQTQRSELILEVHSDEGVINEVLKLEDPIPENSMGYVLTDFRRRSKILRRRLFRRCLQGVIFNIVY